MRQSLRYVGNLEMSTPKHVLFVEEGEIFSKEFWKAGVKNLIPKTPDRVSSKSQLSQSVDCYSTINKLYSSLGIKPEGT
jgi:hypothetical protein